MNSYQFFPKKYLPIYYFDSKETNFPIQSNYYLIDIYSNNYQNINEPVIVPNFINYTIRVIHNKPLNSFSKYPNISIYSNNDIWIYYYYYSFYVIDKNCCYPNINDYIYDDVYPKNIDVKCIVVETKNDELNRILLPYNNTYYWLNTIDTKRIAVNNKCIIYNSYQTHNIYPIKDRVWRTMGINNDICDGSIVKMFSVSKCNDISLESKYYKQFSNLINEDLNIYPEYHLDDIKYRNLFKM